MSREFQNQSDARAFLKQILQTVGADAAALHVPTEQGLTEAASLPSPQTIPIEAVRKCLQTGETVRQGRPGEALPTRLTVPLPGARGTLSAGWAAPAGPDAGAERVLQACAEAARWALETWELRRRLEDCLGDLEDQETAAPPVASGERQAASLSRMARQLGHDLRGPLANLRVALDLLRGADPEDQDPLLDRLDAEIGHATHLITDRVHLTRALQPEEATMTLAAAARQAAMEVRRPSDVRLELNLDPEVTCQGDAELLSRMLVLLAENAVESLDAGGVVRLVVARTQTGSQLRVEDSGPGIPEELRERVLQPGFTTRERGSGLGLTICQRIARAHGGTLHLEGSDLGGAAVVVQLPSSPV